MPAAAMQRIETWSGTSNSLDGTMEKRTGMNLNVDPASLGPRPEPPALAEREDQRTVAVVRHGGFVRVSPTSCSVWSVPDDPGRVEIVFQRLGMREVARRLGGDAGGRSGAGREVRTELEELAAVELSRGALLNLRQEIDRHLGAPGRQDSALDAAARQLLASTRTELSGLQDRLMERLDVLAAKVDASAAGVANIRSALGRDLEELVRMLWPKDRRGR